jgi:hypothetical protein
MNESRIKKTALFQPRMNANERESRPRNEKHLRSLRNQIRIRVQSRLVAVGKPHHPWFVLILFTLAVALSGCEMTRRGRVEGRANAVFHEAILLKPKPGGAALPIERQLAPLIMAEAANAGTEDNPAIKIHCSVGSTQVHGRNHVQLTYWWRVGEVQPPFKRTGDNVGVRLTLDSNGKPVIWETLSSAPGPVIISVAESLNKGAKRAYGPPLPGRDFSIEQSDKEMPDVIVARLVDDAPAVMGPMVYVARSGQITSITCRCMPVQAEKLVAELTYQIVPEDLSPFGFPTQPTTPLESELRLPSTW